MPKELTDAWLTPFPATPAVCVPAPDTRGSKDERRLWVATLEAADRGDHAGARTFIEGQPEGAPRTLLADTIALHAMLAPDGLRTDVASMTERLIAAADSAPSNSCLQHTAGLAALLSGRLPDAKRLSALAVQAMPDHPEVLAGRHTFFALSGKSRPEDSTEPTLQEAVQSHPSHPGLNYLLGLRKLGERDAKGAVAPLQVAREAGLDVTEPLLLATRVAGELDTYLSLASEEGLPLGDGGALASAPDPVQAFQELLRVDEDGTLVATIETSEGELRCELLYRDAPVTVGNFVGLARGTQTWQDPETGEARTTPLYDGTELHRVIPSFMVQGGDPTGTGSGGPGYRFMDETAGATRSFDVPGLLAMANAGPNTNGSQWFITEVPVPYLNGKHTIFGVCDEASLEVVERIARVPRDASDKPQEPVIVERITIGAP